MRALGLNGSALAAAILVLLLLTVACSETESTSPTPVSISTSAPEPTVTPRAVLVFPTATPVPTATPIATAVTSVDGEYAVEIVRVLDGDTVEVEIESVQVEGLRMQTIRIDGVDTPETRTTDAFEKACGNWSKQQVVDFVAGDGEYVLITEFGDGAFGRILGDIRSPSGVLLSAFLLDEGLAVKYDGGTRDWEDHRKNCEKLVEAGHIAGPVASPSTGDSQDPTVTPIPDADPTATPVPTIEPTVTTPVENPSTPVQTVTEKTSTDAIYTTCNEAIDAGLERVQGPVGEGWGFDKNIVVGPRDGDADGYVCEITSLEFSRSLTVTAEAGTQKVSEASPTPTVTATPTHTPAEAPTATHTPMPTVTASTEIAVTYSTCEEAESAGWNGNWEPKAQVGDSQWRLLPANEMVTVTVTFAKKATHLRLHQRSKIRLNQRLNRSRLQQTLLPKLAKSTLIATPRLKHGWSASKVKAAVAAVFLRGRYRALGTAMATGLFARSSSMVTCETHAVEVAGVVEQRHSPAVWSVEVFVQHGDAGVVEQKAPLVSDA